MLSLVQFSDGNSISYLYDADGVKLRTTHVIKGVTTTTDYVGNKVYENGSLKRILIAGSYIENGTYYFYLQDHQGNNCVVIDQAGTIEEMNQYYPFGGIKKQTGNVQPYKYNGKELDRKAGVDWYDYGARMYDPALGRFMTQDPMAEKYYSMSPYVYCANNPVNLVDPDGMAPGWPEFWSSLGKGFSRPFVGLWNTVTNPVETVTNAVNSISQATPMEVVMGAADQMLRNPMSPMAGTMKTLDIVDAIAYDAVNGTMTSAEVVGGQIGDITLDVATTVAGAGISKAVGTVGKAAAGVGKVKGLGNPYKNMTLDQVRTSMNKHVGTGKMKVVHNNKEGLNQAYYNNKSGYSYNLDKGGATRIGRRNIIEGPHVDVNYPKPRPKGLDKKKLPVVE